MLSIDTTYWKQLLPVLIRNTFLIMNNVTSNLFMFNSSTCWTQSFDFYYTVHGMCYNIVFIKLFGWCSFLLIAISMRNQRWDTSRLKIGKFIIYIITIIVVAMLTTVFSVICLMNMKFSEYNISTCSSFLNCQKVYRYTNPWNKEIR